MNGWREKGLRAAGAAKVLFGSGHWEGAIDRAYYAMFDAARAALYSVDEKLADSKTHLTIRTRFSQFVILERGFDRDTGRLLAQVENARLPPDYSMKDVSAASARQAIESMDAFMVSVAVFLKTEYP